MTSHTRRTLLISGAAVLMAAGAASATGLFGFGMKEEEVRPFFTENDVAIRGIDPVAYFTDGGPVPGNPDYAAEWSGTTWHFASAQNRDRFLDTPDAFAPQYGGFCAWAVAEKGELYSTDPEAWAIVDDKLYLNFNASVQKRWEKDVPGFIEAADQRWPEIIADQAAS